MKTLFAALCLASCLAATTPVFCAAGEAPAPVADRSPDDFRNLRLFRFEFDNDNLLGKDSAFTAGLSFQVHSRLYDTWSPGYAKWIGRIPGLGDDGSGGRIVRWAAGISQVIITPQDVGIEAPQPNDAPWVGTLGAGVAWSAYDNRRMGAFQIYAGCLGPCSGAEKVQTFVHQDLGWGEPPKGWKNQLVNRPLGNVNYEYRYKVFADSPDQYFVPSHFAKDLSIGGQAGVGNLETFIMGEFEYRFGWGLPMGFTKTPDPIGWGIMLDPIYVDPKAPLPSEQKLWRTYFTVMGRAAAVSYMAVAEGGPTVNGGDHPALRPYPGRYQTLVGFHIARVPFALHLTYYKYYEQSNNGGIQGSSDWINLSVEWRF
jgi:lipid A 3-O-deacylase